MTSSTWCFTWGMTGRLRIHDGDSEPPPMVRHTFPLDDGREMRFIDPRKFGHLWLLSDPADAMSKMGAGAAGTILQR